MKKKDKEIQSQNKKLVYMTFLQREEESQYHHTYDEELLQYEYLRDGDIRSIEESKRLFRKGIAGHLSDDPLRDKKYLFVASTTLATRFAIEGGMEAQTAYNLSDLYIQKMDDCRLVQEVFDLQTAMITDFTQKMAQLHASETVGGPDSGNTHSSNISKPLWLAMDYIYYHLHTKITLEDVGNAASLSPNYLNSLFKKEKGMTIQQYIRTRRIEAAKNMILYSDYTETEVAEFLAFSSSSHYIKIFREDVGLTPRQYRQKNFRKHRKWSKE